MKEEHELSPVLDHPYNLLHDPEGAKVPEDLPPIVDAHVHLFPDSLFTAIWGWFDRYAWPIRYKLKSQEVLNFLVSRGIGHVIGLHYAHRPGLAQKLNEYMADFCTRNPRVTGLATVFPGEKNARSILEHAFQTGLAGVKLHSHVQCFHLESESMHEIYETCQAWEKPLVMHAGREPKSSAYHCDPYQLCRASSVEGIVKAYPKLRICVPHLGADEYDTYGKMLERYDTLWLDTATVLANYLPINGPPSLEKFRADRIMYGSDFPNLPYAWDRELKKIKGLGLSTSSLELILGENAARFFSLKQRLP